jgi:hypothetical protein
LGTHPIIFVFKKLISYDFSPFLVLFFLHFFFLDFLFYFFILWILGEIGNNFLSHTFFGIFLINRYGDLGVSRCKGKGGGNIPTFTNSPKEIEKWIVESNWTYLLFHGCVS